MASLMITGGKIGGIVGRKRAFAIGCVIYGCGSFVTSISPSLPVLLFGWSFLEGVRAALILPAIVALVASNFARPERPRAYGLVASAGAIAVVAAVLLARPSRVLGLLALAVDAGILGSLIGSINLRLFGFTESLNAPFVVESIVMETLAALALALWITVDRMVQNQHRLINPATAGRTPTSR
jgi:MFS family permease